MLQLFAAGAFGSDIAAQRAFSCGFLVFIEELQ